MAYEKGCHAVSVDTFPLTWPAACKADGTTLLQIAAARAALGTARSSPRKQDAGAVPMPDAVTADGIWEG